MILLSSKTLKTLILSQIIVRNRTKNRGPKLPIFQFHDTFIVQNFKNSHFCPNNYKGIVLKNRVQNGLF